MLTPPSRAHPKPLLTVAAASPPSSTCQAYAHDTAHEKIIRGLALGLALTAYGREEGADGLVEQMSRDQVRAAAEGLVGEGCVRLALASRPSAALEPPLHIQPPPPAPKPQ